MAYWVVNISEEGAIPLAGFETYDEADLACDQYSERYPSAWIDVLNTSEITNAIAP